MSQIFRVDTVSNIPVRKSAFQRPHEAFFGTGMFSKEGSRQIRTRFTHAQRPHLFSPHGRTPAARNLLNLRLTPPLHEPVRTDIAQRWVVSHSSLGQGKAPSSADCENGEVTATIARSSSLLPVTF